MTYRVGRLLTTALVLVVPRALAQDPPDPAEARVLPLRVALLNQSTQLPSVRGLFSSFNPGAQVGSEYAWRKTPGYTLFQSLDLGFYHHPDLATAAFLESSFGYRPTLVAGLFAEVSLGVGYLMSFSALPLFTQEGGVYRHATPVLHRFIGVVALGLGYRIGAFSPFIAYGLMVEVPWLQANLVVPDQYLQLGLRVELPLPKRVP